MTAIPRNTSFNFSSTVPVRSYGIASQEDVPAPISKTRCFFLKVKKDFYKVAEVASAVFMGVRSATDLIDPQKKIFSRKFSQILFFTTAADFLLIPYDLAVAVNDVFSIFSTKSISERVASLFSLIEDATDVAREWAAFFTLLHTVKVISETAIKWINTFNFVSFGVDLISLGKSVISSKHMYTLLKGFTHDEEQLRVQRGLKLKIETAGAILRKIKLKTDDVASNLGISKKALHKKIDELARLILSRSKKKKSGAVRSVNEFLKILSRRAKLQTGLAVVDLVNSAVSSTGNFLGFFPPLLLPSTVILGFTGVVSFALWGSKKICVKKNPF